ncbi:MULTISPECIES: hypothetical protein [Polymorphospora]|uniref:Uncharacterized protein n=1 Tax=Polymorphospora lycopeni TaxID=3140240 RepID=A0ABV5D0A3_9ACTN
MTGIQRNFQHDTDVLIRQVDNHLAVLRTADAGDLGLAERLAASLRDLVVSTTRASAADRAWVRAAVHYFVLRREGRHRGRSIRSLTADQRVINEIALALGRPDLVVDGVTPLAGPARAA